MSYSELHREKWKRVIKFLGGLVILLVEIIIYWQFWSQYYNPLMGRYLWWKGTLLVVTVYGVILFFFQRMYGGLKVGIMRYGNLIYSQILSLTFANIITYFQDSLMAARLLPVNVILWVEGLEIVAVFIWALCYKRIYSWMFPPRKMLLVYGERPAFHLMDKINSRDDKYILSGAIHQDQGIEAIMKAAESYDAVVIGDIPAHMRNLTMKACFDKNIRTYTVPKLSDILLRTSDELNIFDSPLYLSRNVGLAFDQEIAKRIEDVVLASIGLILVSPFFVLISLLIKADDGGPVFFRQKRLTKDGKIFEIYKFRTMVKDAEKMTGPTLAQEKDPRITAVGRFLRACRMDELPQLLNILKGDMSLVGPRPERPELAAVIEKNIPEFSYRLKVKAGLTGYAQYYGKYNTTAYDKLKLDLTYIRNFSILLDLKLILLTPKILFMKESTEGITEDYQDPALIDPDK